MALTTIPAGGFLIIWADNQPEQGALHADFGLSSAGEDVGIYYIDGRKIDDYTFGAQSENVFWGRTTNGTSTWKSLIHQHRGNPINKIRNRSHARVISRSARLRVPSTG
jgi:hypothetical protein